MKKILMLGGGLCQKSGIEKIEELGHKVIVVDYSPAPKALEPPYKHERASTFDIEACTKLALDLNVDGVMTMGTDQPVLTTAHVTQRLNLPSYLSVEEAIKVTNKKAMKECLALNGISTAKWDIVSEKNLEEVKKRFSGKLVIKPLDSQGQRGVLKLAPDELNIEVLKASLAHTRDPETVKEVLLEEYYPSSEVTISAFVSKGEMTILTITDRLHLEDEIHIGIAGGHRLPSIHKDKYLEIERLSKAVQVAFNIQNGPLYIQMLIGEKGILVNELAARLGGAFEDIFISAVTGFDILEAVIKLSLGQEVDTSRLDGYDFKSSKAEAWVELMFTEPGKINYITPLEEILKIPYVLKAGYNYKIGEKVNDTVDATTRLGYVVFANPLAEVSQGVNDFRKKFIVLDENQKNIYRGIEYKC